MDCVDRSHCKLVVSLTVSLYEKRETRIQDEKARKAIWRSGRAPDPHADYVILALTLKIKLTSHVRPYLMKSTRSRSM